MHTNLMQQIASPSNLLSAWRCVRGNIPKYRRHKASGPDGLSINEYETDLHANLAALRYSLLKNKYKPQPAGTFQLQKKNGNGSREISILTIDDRIAQKAAQQVLEPIWEPIFLNCNYGFRPGRSIMDAVNQVNAYRQTGNGWMVDGDIQAFFDEIKTDILLRMIEKQIKKRAVLQIIESWLEVERLQNPQHIQTGNKKFHKNPFQTEFQSSSKTHPQINNTQNSIPETSHYQAQETYPYEDYYDYEPYHQKFNGSSYSSEQNLKKVLTTGSALLYQYVKPRIPEIKNAVTKSFQNPLVGLSISKACLTTGSLLAVAVGAGAYMYFSSQKQKLPVGILQGSPLSPLFANIYLHYFDLPLTKSGYRLVRYADDWVICCPNEETACRAYNDAAVALMKLGLSINKEKSQILAPQTQIPFLGKTV